METIEEESRQTQEGNGQESHKTEDLSNSETTENEESGEEAMDLRKMSSKELGRRGEQAAVRFLERRNCTIIERNWTCLAGEADIIARDDEALRFIEVKTRSDIDHGFPSEAVDSRKRHRYEKIAALYLQQNEFEECRVTFDVISILVTGKSRAFLKYHRDAFACESE